MEQTQQLVIKHQQERLHLQRAHQHGARVAAAGANAVAEGGASTSAAAAADSGVAAAAAANPATRAAYFNAQAAQLARRQQFELAHLQRLQEQLRAQAAVSASAATAAPAAAAPLPSAGGGGAGAARPPTAVANGVPDGAARPGQLLPGSPASSAGAAVSTPMGGASPMQQAAAAVWDDEDHVKENREMYLEKYRIADRILGNVPGYVSPDAGFFLWLPVTNGEEATLKLWKQTGVRVLPGNYLAREAGGQTPGVDRIRVAMVAEEKQMERGLQAIRETLYQ